jgi:hypothetical protein
MFSPLCLLVLVSVPNFAPCAAGAGGSAQSGSQDPLRQLAGGQLCRSGFGNLICMYILHIQTHIVHTYICKDIDIDYKDDIWPQQQRNCPAKYCNRVCEQCN